jgi:hypothetical protein
VQVGALEEGDAVGGRGLGDDERVGFHTYTFGGKSSDSQVHGKGQSLTNKGLTQACQRRQPH